MDTVTLSLVSHTNVGKTTLARTLLRRDIGEVLDQPHVTEVSEAHELIETAAHRLLLWDTPGLGDTASLLRRLRREKQPVGWFLHQVWDRAMNRPLWCSQEALRNVREDADVVLYLVNASEDPEDAGYVTPELEILSWIGRPTLVILNQTGEAQGSDADRLVQAWRDYVERFEIVRGFLTLDAFTRCWVQESVLLDRVPELLEGDARVAMTALAEAWRERNNGIFRSSVELVASELTRAALDGEPLPGRLPSRQQKEDAMKALGQRLETSEARLWDDVIAAHGLEGRYATELLGHLDAFLVTGEVKLTRERGALIGGVVSGALGGLTADVLAGGLSFGGGMLAGALLGALGGVGLSQAVQLLSAGDGPRVSWSPAFLDQLLERSILRYLAVAHFGRGRGRFDEEVQPEAWRETLASVLEPQRDTFASLWKSRPDEAALRARLERLIERVIRGVLRSVYPEGFEPRSPGA